MDFFLVCHLNVGFGLFSRTKIKSTQNSAQTLALLVMATQINTFQFYLHHFIYLSLRAIRHHHYPIRWDENDHLLSGEHEMAADYGN